MKTDSTIYQVIFNFQSPRSPETLLLPLPTDRTSGLITLDAAFLEATKKRIPLLNTHILYHDESNQGDAFLGNFPLK
jgi:hypothetical protein